jgi:hypothetical protein
MFQPIGILSSVQEPTRNESVIVTNANREISVRRQMSELRRKELIIRNISTAAVNDVITIVLGNQIAVADAGIVLRSGDILNISENSPESTVYQGVITAICNQASIIPNLSIFER